MTSWQTNSHRQVSVHLTFEMDMSKKTAITFVHQLLRAKDWQERPEIEKLCKWWREGGTGVCALIGIGGSGKTAIVDRFLRVLPVSITTRGNNDKYQLNDRVEQLFVFSFYDAPNVDQFFMRLGNWAKRNKTARSLSFEETLELLEQASPSLVVLDGLEKVQEDGLRGTVFGRIDDGRLREFVLRVAEGLLPSISIIITSRFRLFDAIKDRCQHFIPISVDKLDCSTAISLLRQRGVKSNTDMELAELARDYGFHALTIDLLGGYITHFCQSDARRLPPESKELYRLASNQWDKLDPDVAAVREQEYRFGRIAERYRRALEKDDPAALALLQRMCLFRLGINVKTIVSIFTGHDKVRISGKALALLSERDVQAKLRFLVEMRLIEVFERTTRVVDQKSLREYVRKFETYSIHPAVREGFLKSLDPQIAKRSHDAARLGLETSLADRPGEGAPSDEETLDVMEEILYHSLRANNSMAAWEIYYRRMGGYRNLGSHLGAYHRGERVCRAFFTLRSPERPEFVEGLDADIQMHCLNEWGLFLKMLGRVGEAVAAFDSISLTPTKENYRAKGFQHLADTELLAGRVQAARKAALDSSECAVRSARDAKWEAHHVYRANADFFAGDFRQFLSLATHYTRLNKQHGVVYAKMLNRLGRDSFLFEYCKNELSIGQDSQYAPQYSLLLGEILCRKREYSAAEKMLNDAHDWALRRDAKEQLVWERLVRVRIAVEEHLTTRKTSQNVTELSNVDDSLFAGLRETIGCGFGLYHIDLLLERARLHLLRGDAGAAMDDIKVALDTGIPANAEAAQSEMLAAKHETCSYAWAIPIGLQLRAEAILLQAAQRHGTDSFVPAKMAKLPEDTITFINVAKDLLHQALDLWQTLHDPEPERDDQNFKLDGKQYNYKAVDTYRILMDLEKGLLTQYLLRPFVLPQKDTTISLHEENSVVKFNVFLCHNSKDKPSVRQLKQRLTNDYQLTVWLDEDELRPGFPWQKLIEEGIKNSESIAVLFGAEGLGQWEDEEMQAALQLGVKEGRAAIPVLLPNAPAKLNMPMFLGNRTWVDLRGGLTKEGLDRLVWGVKGTKANP